MTKPDYTSLELRMLARRVIHVVNYVDEEQEIPWDFVERTGGGEFEAFVTTVDTDARTATPQSIGVFSEIKAAVRAIKLVLACGVAESISLQKR